VVITALGHPDEDTASISLLDLTLYEKQVRGSLSAARTASTTYRGLLELANLGQLKLAELITREYTIEQVNQGYEDMREGRNSAA